MNHPLRTFAVTLLCGATGLMLLSCGKPSPGQPASRSQAPVPVVLKPVRTQQVQRTVDLVGTLNADEESVISAKVPGRIIKLYKDVGDSVEPGEPLVQLKPNDYQLAVNKAQLAMEQTLARLGLTELPPKDYDVRKVPTVVKAELQTHNAQSRRDRGLKLFKAEPPLMSKQDFDDLETTLHVAQSNHEVEMLNARAIVAEAWALKGDLDIAKQRLTDATTRAPSPAGADDIVPGTPPQRKRTYRVTHRYVNEGELVREITPCFRLIDDTIIKLRAKVPERFIGRIKAAADVAQRQKVSVTIDAYPDKVFTGTVSRVSPQIDSDTRTFIIEVEIENRQGLLKPGAFARASVETHIDPGVMLVPQEAIISFAGVQKIYTVDTNNKAVEVAIEQSDFRSKDNYVEVRLAKPGAIKDGDLVAIKGAAKLATGVPVQIETPATAPASAPATAPTSRPGGTK